MAQRLIVPDTSVMLPAYFPETLNLNGQSFKITPRARRLAAAIELGEVTAFAPHQLLYEFTKRAKERASPRDGVPTDEREVVIEQVSAFFRTVAADIVWVPSNHIAQRAWTLMMDHNLAPPDSWYLACAELYRAELWISHSHSDGFVDHARNVYDQVYTLTERTFDHL